MVSSAAHIAFLDVDDADKSLVLEHFPEAQVFGTKDKDALEQCRDADVISAFITTKFSAQTLARLPSLKLLITRSVGYDHIDVDACLERKIVACNVPDYGSHVIAEHVFALLLSTLRHIPEGDKRVQGGIFDYHGLRGVALRGKTLGIIGTGKIGRRVAQIAHGFGMKILAADHCRTMELVDLLGVEYVPFDDVLKRSDIITLHMPATPETEHIINAHALGLMKDGVILVNTARGSLIDSHALITALESGKVKYALLDVLEHEQNFAEDKALIKHPNVIATPHVAFYADDSMRNMYLDCFQTIEQWSNGQTPEHVIKRPQVVCDLPVIRAK